MSNLAFYATINMKKLEIHNSGQAVISQVAVWRLLSQENTETQRAQEWSDAKTTVWR